MRIYLKDNHAKCHLDTIWNDRGFLKIGGRHKKNEKKHKKNNNMSSDMRSAPDPKIS